MALPKWKLTSFVQYANGPFGLFLQARFIDHGKLSYLYNVNGWDVANNYVPSATYFDARLSYQIDIKSTSVELYGEVNNIFDRAPPIVPAYSSFTSAPTQTNPTLYDVLGRRFSIGLKLKM
jgi:iron complex outermembrane receptor protein